MAIQRNPTTSPAAVDAFLEDAPDARASSAPSQDVYEKDIANGNKRQIEPKLDMGIDFSAEYKAAVSMTT